MKILIRKSVYDEIMKGIIYHTRVSSKGKPYEVPYHTKDDYEEIHKLRIFEELSKSKRAKILDAIQDSQKKYYSFFKKKADKIICGRTAKIYCKKLS